MSLSMYSQTVPVFVRNLTNLSAILDKAAKHCADNKIDPGVLLSSRLFPDMFPLSKQIQLVSDHAKGGAARLAGVENPKYEDTETTLDELKARIARTVSFVQSIAEAQYAGADTRSVTVPMRAGPKTFVGLDYLNHAVLPNFYFHLTTAYNILRHNGVPLGKSDFIGPTQ